MVLVKITHLDNVAPCEMCAKLINTKLKKYIVIPVKKIFIESINDKSQVGMTHTEIFQFLKFQINILLLVDIL